MSTLLVRRPTGSHWDGPGTPSRLILALQPTPSCSQLLTGCQLTRNHPKKTSRSTIHFFYVTLTCALKAKVPRSAMIVLLIEKNGGARKPLSALHHATQGIYGAIIMSVAGICRGRTPWMHVYLTNCLLAWLDRLGCPHLAHIGLRLIAFVFLLRCQRPSLALLPSERDGIAPRRVTSKDKLSRLAPGPVSTEMRGWDP